MYYASWRNGSSLEASAGLLHHLPGRRMNTAEKRAALAGDGEPWPACVCHDEPMGWQREPDLPAGGRFRCRIGVNTYKRRRREERLQAGTCGVCGGPLATVTMCRPCADANADANASPVQALKKRAAKARRRQQRRAEEGFQPTGVGLAAFAAWTREGTNP